ncbi:MAG: NAD(P)H:quinone oxidoreductase [Armatimonadia bacterium]
MSTVYIPFYSRYGNVEQMALAVAEGVREAGGEPLLAFTGDLMTPPEVIAADARWQQTHERLTATYPRASSKDLSAADGVAFGAPTRFGVMAAQMKNFFDMLAGVWLAGTCNDKPAGCFTSTATMHGGQEISNYTMWPVLAHLGFVIVGVCYATPELQTTTTGGGPYGPSHLAGGTGEIPVDETEKIICRALGSRIAALADRLL